jgi:hypothetical protein
MTKLAMISTAVGSLAVAVRLPGVVEPEKFREHLIKFPRSIWWGRILMGIAAAIAWWIMYHAATDDWEWAQPLILIGVPVAYALVISFAASYLALRGTAALMLMIAKVMVDAADWSEAPLRLVATVLAYLWVIAAIWMTVAPHHFRDLIAFMMANNKRCRLACGAGIVVGLVLVALGIFVY